MWIFCTMIHPIFSDMKQASLPSSIAERALARDEGCIFTGDSPTSDSDNLVVTWILGYSLLYHMIDTTDPRWTTPHNVEVYAYHLVRQKMAE